MLVHPKLVIATALALGVKGRWVYHLITNNYSVREANRASSADIDSLHDLGDECVAACKAVMLLDPQITDVTEVANTLKSTISLFDRFPKAAKVRIEETLELQKKLDDKAIVAFAHQFAASVIQAEQMASPTRVLELLYRALHYASVAKIPLRGNDLGRLVPKLISAHKMRTHASDRAILAVLHELSCYDKSVLAKALMMSPVFKRNGLDSYRVADVVYNSRGYDPKPGDIARALVKEFAGK